MDKLTPEQAEEERERKRKIRGAFAGKTVAHVEYGGVNAWMFHFTDGTKQEIIAEDAVHTPYGNIPGIFLSNELS